MDDKGKGPSFLGADRIFSSPFVLRDLVTVREIITVVRFFVRLKSSAFRHVARFKHFFSLATTLLSLAANFIQQDQAATTV